MRFYKAKKNAVICVHGGGWVGGSPNNPNFKDIELFTEAGLDVYAIDYQLATPEKPSFPIVLWNIQWNINNIRASGQYDKIILLGSSAGATIAALSTINYTKKNHPDHQPADALALYYGLYDFTTAEADLSPEVYQMFRTFMGPWADNTDYLKRVSPVNSMPMRVKEMPVLLSHGRQDTTINVSQTYNLYPVFKNAVASYPDMPHAYSVNTENISFLLERLTGEGE